MNKLIRDLVEASYKNGILDAQIVEAISDKLSYKELKNYINALKLSEKKRTLIIETPSKDTKLDEAELEKTFGKKTVVYVQKPELLAGVRIIDNDTVYNMNLKNNLERLAAYAAE